MYSLQQIYGVTSTKLPNRHCDRHYGDIVHHRMIISYFLKNSLCLSDFASLHQLIFVSSMHQKPINAHHALRVSVHVNIS